MYGGNMMRNCEYCEKDAEDGTARKRGNGEGVNRGILMW